MKYNVSMKEYGKAWCHSVIEVDADSEEEALERVKDGDGYYIDSWWDGFDEVINQEIKIIG